MEKADSILTKKDYGRINLKVKEVLDSRGITRNTLARLIGTRFEVVDKWYENQVEKIDTDVLARMCFALKCEVSDLVEYTKE